MKSKTIYYLQYLIGWISVILGGLGCLSLLNSQTLSPRDIFLILSCLSLGLWTFRLVHELIPGILLIVGFMGFSLNTPTVVLGGFSTPIFFLALCTFIIGTYVIDSRVCYRFIEWFLKFLPLSPFWMYFGVFIVGFFMTLMIPSFHSRIQIAQDMCRRWAPYMGLTTASPQLNFFVISFYQSIFLFSPIFLTGSLYNFIIISFFHFHDQIRFSWLTWFSYGFLPLLILWVGVLIFLWITSYQSKLTIQRNKSLEHIALLGEKRLEEKISLVLFVMLIGGFITSSFHQISPTLWAGLVLLFLLLQNSFSFDIIQKELKWTDLLLLGCLGSVAPLAENLEVFSTLKTLLPISQWISQEQTFFLVALTIGISLIRFILPYRTVILLGAFCLIPFSYTTTIQAWIIAFILLTSASSSWRVRESLGLMLFLKIFSCEWDYAHLRKCLIYFNILRILSIILALGYWQSQGLL